MMSVELKLEPMWPDPACMIMNSVLMRHRSATSPARAIGSLTPLAHRAKHLARHERQRVVADECSIRKIFFTHESTPMNSELLNCELELYRAVHPPSTTRVAPVMYEEAREARNSTAPL